MRPKKYKLALADDQVLFRQGLRNLLEKCPDFKVVMEAGNGRELLDAMAKDEPDAVLLDLEMPEMDGEAATLEIVKKFPHVKILILSMYADECLMTKLITLGAHGYLTKSDAIDTVIKAVHALQKRGYYLSEAVIKAMARNMHPPKKNTPAHDAADLSHREIEIIQLICQQYTNREIADKLRLSSRTIDAHRNTILAKTHSKNTAGIVLYAIENKLFKNTTEQ